MLGGARRYLHGSVLINTVYKTALTLTSCNVLSEFGRADGSLRCLGFFSGGCTKRSLCIYSGSISSEGLIATGSTNSLR